jgi:inhibitor of cysteine peptidase
MYAIAFALLLLMACTPSADPANAVPAPRSESPAAAPAGQDSLIQARVGEEFVITLQSNPSTGYRWMLADSLDAGLLRLAGRTYVPDQPVMPGSGGHEQFTFVGVAPGETTLRLRYSRHVQRSAPRRAEFGVRIHPAQ